MSQNHGGWIVRFGVYEANLKTGELRKQGARIKLQEQPFQVLAMLLEKPGEIVTREEMQQRLWPKDTFVDFDHSLNKAVNKVRDALCDSADNPRFVETLARRGYRFLAPVHYPDPEGKHSEDSGSSPAVIGADASVCQIGSGLMTTIPATTQEPVEIEAKPAANPFPWWRRYLWTAAFICLLASASVAYLFRPEMPAPRIARVVQLTNDGVTKEWLNWGGSKLFFTMIREGKNRIFQMPDEGGTPQDISHFFPDKIINFRIWNVSNDGNRLLLTYLEKPASEFPVWTFDFRNQALQRLGNLKGRGFRMSPDEKKIAILNGRDLYMAEADGSQLKKIYSFKNESVLWRWHPDGKSLRVILSSIRLKVGRFGILAWMELVCVRFSRIGNLDRI